MVVEDDDMAKEARVLNRIGRWHPRKEIACEADSRHTEILIRNTGAEKLKDHLNTGYEGNGKRDRGGKEARLKRAQLEWQGEKHDGQ